jgi:hypothetical protein
VDNNHDEGLGGVVNVAKMCQMLNLSRSRFYQLIEQNFFLHPVYLLSSKRPIYTQEMVKINLEVRRQNVGVNGKIVMFYSPRTNDSPTTPARKRDTKEAGSKTVKGAHKELIVVLESLGLANITAAQVGSAVKICFPQGTQNVDFGDVVKDVFRHIKCQNSSDNVER